MEAARLVETSKALSPYGKEQEVEVVITRKEMHLFSNPVKGDMTY